MYLNETLAYSYYQSIKLFNILLSMIYNNDLTPFLHLPVGNRGYHFVTRAFLIVILLFGYASVEFRRWDVFYRGKHSTSLNYFIFILNSNLHVGIMPSCSLMGFCPSSRTALIQLAYSSDVF